jgi:hypothetical protein
LFLETARIQHLTFDTRKENSTDRGACAGNTLTTTRY